MDELEALELLQQQIPKAGDDCGIIDDTAITTDMLHERTDFPDGISAYTVGWRSLGVSLSDIAAVGADPIGGVAVYAAPAFRKEALQAFLSGAVDICEAVETEYIGGDLDTHSELTVVSTVIGRTTKPVSRSGANIGDHVCVTGTLGRSAAGVEYFQNDTPAKGNELFQFEPRVESGKILRNYATSMIDSSDGLARSLHQLAHKSNCGFSIQSDRIPIDEAVYATTESDSRAQELAIKFGEDFELIWTIPEDDIGEVQRKIPVQVSDIGIVTDNDVKLDGEPLANTGWTHG